MTEETEEKQKEINKPEEKKAQEVESVKEENVVFVEHVEMLPQGLLQKGIEEKVEQKLSNKVEKKKIDENVIYIGDKPFPNYEAALSMQMSRKEQKETKIIARGMNISRAVSIAELAKKRFSAGENKIKEVRVEISSERFSETGRNGKKRNVTVPVILITIEKE